MDKVSAAAYLPIDVVGIGSIPLILFIVSAVLIVLGSVAAALMLFQFRMTFVKSLAVLLIAFICAGITGFAAYGGYQGKAAANLASNMKTKYPSITLQNPEQALTDYLTSGSKAEVTVTSGDKSYKYGIDLSTESSEPSLVPTMNGDAPNPIQFIKSGSTS